MREGLRRYPFVAVPKPRDGTKDIADPEASGRAGGTRPKYTTRN